MTEPIYEPEPVLPKKTFIQKLADLKEKILRWERFHPHALKYVGIGLAIILGGIVLLNVGLYLRNLVADTVGMGFSLKNIKNIAIIGSIVFFVVTLVRNIITKGFSLTKFAAGFNIFSGPVQGKLIYYGIIFSIVAAVSFGVYNKITQASVETNNRNTINGAGTVTIDQRTITPIETENLLIGIKIFGFNIGISHHSMPKIDVNNTNTAKEKPKKVAKPKAEKK